MRQSPRRLPATALLLYQRAAPAVERQDRVAREIGGNGLCRCRMDLHHFVEVGEDRLDDGISETLRQIGRATAKL